MWRAVSGRFPGCCGWRRGGRLLCRPSLGRCKSSSSSSSSRGAVSVSVTPSAGLADRPATIRVSGLIPGQEVTLRALVASEQGSLFDSCAHYRADAAGEVDVSVAAASRGGDYEGCEPMGLFWSLAPAAMEKPYQRLEPRDVEVAPVTVEVSVHGGHSPPDAIPGHLLAKTRAQRWFTSPGVRKIRLKEGAVRGSLFLPPGVSLCQLCPKLGNKFLDTFSKNALDGSPAQQAVKAEIPSPNDCGADGVKGPGIGVVGTGKGAELALSMVTFLTDVVAAVCISGCSSVTASALHYGEVTLPGLGFNMSRIRISESGIISPLADLNTNFPTMSYYVFTPMSLNIMEHIFIGHRRLQGPMKMGPRVSRLLPFQLGKCNKSVEWEKKTFLSCCCRQNHFAKATTIKEALAKWEEKNGQKPSEAKEVKLYAQIPPIEKMDASLSTLVNCEKLSLSTNCIEKIANLNGLKNLRILSLGRNNIKNLNGLEAVGDTLEELWISYNLIEKLKGLHVMKKLKILYMSNNLVKDWAEFVRLAELPLLEDLVFVGNPLEEKYSADSQSAWVEEATKRVPKLKKLDGIPVIKQEEGEEGEN
ncbi:hypothetical protein JRQ81_000728 [Phrynocephalus forsythii]|uniref:Dynein axonemal light chain 1 n=2 Tax=Agamidae TaxID=81953 RepID=A0A9Q1B7A6_9SAUR|nr:hypothetical protein JRQ81_000728 [Phrynocephalus forsythii]